MALPDMLRLPAEVMEEWEKSEKFMQDTLSPLLNHINALSSCKKGEAPTRRLAIIQVCVRGCGQGESTLTSSLWPARGLCSRLSRQGSR
jgi:hypothetical protein